MGSSMDAVIHPRWLNRAPSNLEVESRMLRAAKLIAPSSRVLDIGCGTRALRDMLPEGCTYVGSDVIARHPDTIVANLNMAEFPLGEFDVALLLGVVEYLENPIFAFRSARRQSSRLIFSYTYDRLWTRRRIARWEKIGRMNFMRDWELDHLLRATGWQISHVENITAEGPRLLRGTRLYVCD